MKVLLLLEWGVLFDLNDIIFCSCGVVVCGEKAWEASKTMSFAPPGVWEDPR